MSLINGVLHFDNPPLESETITRMMDAGKESCPDGSGRWRDDQIALGFNLLQTLPSHRCASAPFRDAGSDMVIVADARLDNRIELAHTMEFGGIEQLSDAEIILHAFQKWGEACVEHLVGDFAFAIWDARKRKLFCARDSFGVKPFFYFHSRQAFIFSSTVLSMLQAKEVSRVLNDEYIADSLVGLTLEGNATIYRDIAALPAAHCLSVGNGIISLRCYWEPGSENEAIRFARDDDYVERYRELFTEAVRCRVETEGEVASMLSGGLDSSSIATVAGELLDSRNKKLPTFSFVLADSERQFNRDEKHLIALLHNLKGLDGNFISSEDFVRLPLGQHYESYQHLPLGHAPFMSILFSRLREKNIKVVLDGYGGDQCATCESPPPLQELLSGMQLARLLRYVRAASGFNGSSTPGIIKSLLTRHFRKSAGLDLADVVLSRSVLSQGLRERTQIMERARRNPLFHPVSKRSLREIMQQRLCVSEKAFRYTELFSLSRVEMRYPMLDRRLVDFCLAVPPEQHNFDMNRRLIRRAMQGKLPDEVRLRHNKFISNTPGAINTIFAHRDFFLSTIEAAQQNRAVADCIDTGKLKKRFAETLPQVINQTDKTAFMPGPTMRGIVMLYFLKHHVSGCAK